MKLYLENVRSFEGWHEIPIAPATVLLGENSAGKTTLLGMLSVVHNEGFPFGGNLFNQSPFELGGYKTIASSKKSVKHFSVGYQAVSRHERFQYSDGREKPVFTGLIASFRENAGLPALCHVIAWSGDVAVVFFEEDFEHLNSSLQVQLPTNLKFLPIKVIKTNVDGLSEQHLYRSFYEQKSKTKEQSKSKNEREEAVDLLIHRLRSGFMRWDRLSALAFAPMRSQPKRTYDQLSDAFSPGGDHVPLLLARAADPNNKQAVALHDALRDFGRYSQMFSDIGVKQLGKGSGDPFQVQVKIGTKTPNLMDVGYGVSQVLPLIVDAHRASPQATLLLQQPEVHLHPKAQAALGSMIKDWVSKSKKTVVVETHSDYLVDRLRLEVKRGNLKPSDVQIYFLEKSGTQTKRHALEIDAQGNVLNTPQGYRDFFLREQMALLMDDEHVSDS